MRQIFAGNVEYILDDQDLSYLAVAPLPWPGSDLRVAENTLHPLDVPLLLSLLKWNPPSLHIAFSVLENIAAFAAGTINQ